MPAPIIQVMAAAQAQPNSTISPMPVALRAWPEVRRAIEGSRTRASSDRKRPAANPIGSPTTGITKKPTIKQLNALEELAHQVEALWMLAYRRLVVAEQESRRSIKLWGLDE